MYTVPPPAVAQWSAFGDRWLPVSIDAPCPHCGGAVNFAAPSWHFGSGREVASVDCVCPRCRKSVLFVAVGIKPSVEQKECAELCMHPAPMMTRQPMTGLVAAPERVSRAYLAAVKVFNVGEWAATAGMAGRALEGIVKHLLPEDKRELKLAAQLHELARAGDLAAPLHQLADSIREGRNLGAHFDLEKEPDAETAQMMLDLLEYFMEYLFILPDRVKELRAKL